MSRREKRLTSPGGDLLRAAAVVASSDPSTSSTAPVQVARMRLKPFAPSCVSRHFLVFDSAISRTQRILFQLGVLSTHISEDMSFTRSSFIGVEKGTVHQIVLPPYCATQLLELRIINDVKHPAHGQIGLFAKVAIPRDTVITAYSGIVEYCRRLTGSRTYTMGFGSTASNDFVVDGEVVGDFGRFANDPRNTRRTDNLNAVSRVSKFGETFTAMVTKRGVVAGEELLLNYGKSHQMFATEWTAHDGTPVTRPRRVAHLPSPHLKENELSKAQFKTFWHCAFCCWWSTSPAGGSSSMIDVQTCSRCGSPRIPRSRVAMALVESETAVAGGNHEVIKNEEGSDDGEVTADASSSSTRKRPRAPPSSASSSLFRLVVPDQERDSKATATAALSGGSSTIPTSWPITIPFVSWIVWDPAIPLAQIYDHSSYFQWAGIDGRVDENGQPVTLLSTQPFKQGQVIGPVGGIVVTLEYAERVKQFEYPWIRLPNVLPEEDGSNRSKYDDALPALALIVTNEFACCRGISARRGGGGAGGEAIVAGAGGGNVELAFLRDELGTIYVGAVAARAIHAYDELVYAVPC